MQRPLSRCPAGASRQAVRASSSAPTEVHAEVLALRPAMGQGPGGSAWWGLEPHSHRIRVTAARLLLHWCLNGSGSVRVRHQACRVRARRRRYEDEGKASVQARGKQPLQQQLKRQPCVQGLSTHYMPTDAQCAPAGASRQAVRASSSAPTDKHAEVLAMSVSIQYFVCAFGARLHV